MVTNNIITVQNTDIRITEIDGEDYISLTDMVKAFDNSNSLIESWLRNKNTIEFLGVWESLNNPNFNSIEFEGIKNQAGLNRFAISAKRWASTTNAIGIVAKTGRYNSGTFAHKDIAIEFGSWLSPEFKLYLIKEFQRLKQKESSENQLEWNVKRILSKVNYRIHTDAIKVHLIPPELSGKQQSFIYASEADLLNKALFGMSAKEWRDLNPNIKGNLRDQATIEQLTVLASLESQNALLIEQGVDAKERLIILNKQAIKQMHSLLDNKSVLQLKDKPLLIE